MQLFRRLFGFDIVSIDADVEITDKKKAKKMHAYRTDTDFEWAVKIVLESEGVLSSHANDRGGLTKYGITQATWTSFKSNYPQFVASEFAYEESVAKIDVEQAKEVYYHMYWLAPKIGMLKDKYIKAECFDMAVNAGASVWVKILQRACNFCRYPEWDAIKVDGLIGNQTINRVEEFISRGTNIRNAVCIAQAGFKARFYQDLVEREPQRYLSFSRGWSIRTTPIMYK